MNIEELVKDTFTAHEDLTPDQHTVMSVVRERTAPRSRAAAVRRPLAAMASIGAVAAVAAGAVLLAENHDTAPTHRQPAAHSHSAPSTHKHRAVAKKSTAPLTMPYDLGWVPDGVHPTLWRINAGGSANVHKLSPQGEYMLQGRGLYIDVQQMGGGLDGLMFKSGGGKHITIDGEPGIESANPNTEGGYEVYFRSPSGGVLYVNVSDVDNHVTGKGAHYRSVGRHIARAITFPGKTAVHPSFGLGYLPSGMRVQAFDVDHFGMDGKTAHGLPTTSYQIGTSFNHTTIGVGMNYPQAPTGQAGRTVQGHPTRYTISNGSVTLFVLEAVGGAPVVVSGPSSLDEAYKIADGLTLPH